MRLRDIGGVGGAIRRDIDGTCIGVRDVGGELLGALLVDDLQAVVAGWADALDIDNALPTVVEAGVDGAGFVRSLCGSGRGAVDSGVGLEVGSGAIEDGGVLVDGDETVATELTDVIDLECAGFEDLLLEAEVDGFDVSAAQVGIGEFDCVGEREVGLPLYVVSWNGGQAKERD